MKIRLLRASNAVKELEFAATMPPLDIQRLSVDLMFENFEPLCVPTFVRSLPASYQKDNRW